MSHMSTAYETHGRTAQKQRTRAALVAAARQLMTDGETPTVEATADAASISRTTAYRYFANQRELLVAAFPETDMSSLLPPDAPSGAQERIRIAVARFLKTVADTEAQQRTMLRLSLEDGGTTRDLPLRKGRAIGWFTDALEPARAQLGDDGIRKLVLALRSSLGIESFVWLVDIAGLSRRQAVAQLQWTADMLVAAAFATA